MGAEGRGGRIIHHFRFRCGCAAPVCEQTGVTIFRGRYGKNSQTGLPQESFFATLKKELVHHETYRTHAEARQSLFEYIEVFYNRVRRHSALGYKSPALFVEAI
jgi:transposase InsO family protein